METPDAATLRALFDSAPAFTVGLEEEVMVLEGETLDLAPRGAEVLAALPRRPVASDAPRFAPELVAAQLEIITPPLEAVPDAAAFLAAGRRALAEAAERAGGLRLACAGAHPFAAVEGELTEGERYAAIAAEYGVIARRQLVCALQVHVAVPGADRALAVHNALRSHLPELAALAANAPFHGGRDIGLASVRPTVSEQLPRQGMPPELPTWEAYAAALRRVGDPGVWWWELRPHPRFGTLEIRVPDAQATVREAAAVAAVAHSLAAWLAERFDSGERLPVHERWVIEENRWSACRHGLAGEMLDLESGRRTPTRERTAALLDALGPVAERLRCADELADARAMLRAEGSAALLREAALGEPRAAARVLSSRFLEGT